MINFVYCNMYEQEAVIGEKTLHLDPDCFHDVKTHAAVAVSLSKQGFDVWTIADTKLMKEVANSSEEEAYLFAPNEESFESTIAVLKKAYEKSLSITDKLYYVRAKNLIAKDVAELKETASKYDIIIVIA